MAKVCIVAPVHNWDDVRVFHKEALTLSACGFDVHLLAKSGRRDVVDGVNIHPVMSSNSRKHRFLSLILVFFQALKIRADIYHLHNPDTLPIGLVLKALGFKVLYDTHEDFTKRILIREWIPAPLRRVLATSVGLGEKLMGQIADAVFVTQEDVAKRVGKRSIVLGNPPRANKSLLDKVACHAQAINDNFRGLRVVYLGGLNENRGLFDMVDALDSANMVLPVRLWLAGTISDKDLERAEKLPGWRYVDFLGRIPQVDAFAYVSRSQVGLIVLRDTGGFGSTDPNKIYEYLALSVPFIASGFPLWRKRLDGAKAGWFVSPGSSKALSDLLVNIAGDPDEIKKRGFNGRNFIESYNWEKESEIMIDVYKGLIA